jgi:hypothetical protein
MCQSGGRFFTLAETSSQFQIAPGSSIIKSVAAASQDQQAISEMKSLPEKDEYRGDEYDGSRPNRQPNQWFLAVRGIYQTDERHHITDDPDHGSEARSNTLTVVSCFGQPHWMAAIHASCAVGVHFAALGFGIAPPGNHVITRSEPNKMLATRYSGTVTTLCQQTSVLVFPEGSGTSAPFHIV